MALGRNAERAEELIDRAWEAGTDAARVKYARKALTIDPDAFDAYVILALCTDVLGEQVALLREAVRIGKLRWAEAIKRPSQHDFWLDMETRSFMRAAHNLALALWQRGEREEAVAFADFLLKLNANDNQGIRYLALAWHEALSNHDAVERLLKRYRRDRRTEFLYSAALAAFRRRESAGPLLNEAWAANPHVPDLLLDHSAMPGESGPPYVGIGSREEAAGYVDFAREAWLKVSGALEWLAQQRVA